MNQTATLIGIDLGSFKTAASASNGRRVAVPSVIGWPQTPEAREALGKDFACGGELSKQKVPLDTCWPFRRGLQKAVEFSDLNVAADVAAKHREAGKLVMKHVVSLTAPVPTQPIYAVVTVPSRTSKKCQQALLDTAREHLDAIMLVPEAFCVAFSLGIATDCLVIDLGAGKIDVCAIVTGQSFPEQGLTVTQGCESIEVELVSQMKVTHPDLDLPLNAARQIKESVGCLPKPTDTACARLNGATSSQEVNVTVPLRAATRKLVPTIVGAVREVVSRFEPTTQRSLLSNILLTGGGSQLKGLSDLLVTALQPAGETKITSVADPVFAAATGALKLAMATPLSQWQHLQRIENLRGPVISQAMEQEMVKRAA